MSNFRIPLLKRIELRKMLDAVVRRQTVKLLVDYRAMCNETQIDKSKGEDYKFVWKVFWAIPRDDRREWVRSVYADNCNDDHIASALLDWKRVRLTSLLCELEERENES